MGGAFIGVQIPSFVNQYEQRLESHFLESQTNLEGFQVDANKYFNGDIEELIRHYAKDNDPVISDGGESIASLHSRALFLKRSWAEFNASLHHRYWHALASPVKTIRQETWKSYDFAVRLDLSGIIWALGLGLALSLIIELCLNILRLAFSFKKPQQNARQDAPTLHVDLDMAP